VRTPAPVELRGRHVRLEPLAPNHLPGLCAVGLEPDLWRWSTEPVRTVDDMRDYVQRALASQAAGSAIPFAVVLAADGTVVGSTRYANIAVEHDRLEIGWTWYGPRWQRTAVNTECKLLLLRHAFETLDAVRVELKTDALNARSRAAILRLGAVEEGTLRAHMRAADGRRRDTVYYSILREAWPAVRDRLEQRLARGGPAPSPPGGRRVS
jgi:RimJ/RimL family protein N-acetyltransferase